MPGLMQVETGSAITWKYPSVVLKGDNSVGEFYSVALTNNYQQVLSVNLAIHVHDHWRVGSSLHWLKEACRSCAKRCQTWQSARCAHCQWAVQADTGTKMLHIGKNTRSRIISKGISAGNSRNCYRGLVQVCRLLLALARLYQASLGMLKRILLCGLILVTALSQGGFRCTSARVGPASSACDGKLALCSTAIPCVLPSYELLSMHWSKLWTFSHPAVNTQ